MHAYGVCINLCMYLSLISQVGAGLGTGDETFKLVLDRITAMDMDVFCLNLELIVVISPNS